MKTLKLKQEVAATDRGARITQEILAELVARIKRLREAVTREMESAGRPAA